MPDQSDMDYLLHVFTWISVQMTSFCFGTLRNTINHVLWSWRSFHLVLDFRIWSKADCGVHVWPIRRGSWFCIVCIILLLSTSLMALLLWWFVFDQETSFDLCFKGVGGPASWFYVKSEWSDVAVIDLILRLPELKTRIHLFKWHSIALEVDILIFMVSDSSRIVSCYFPKDIYVETTSDFFVCQQKDS